jgi:hypothetical protein
VKADDLTAITLPTRAAEPPRVRFDLSKQAFMAASLAMRAAFCLFTMAEDKRFELLRGCPQHAFQVCGCPFS